MKSFLTPPPDLFAPASWPTFGEASGPLFTAGELAIAEPVALATDEVGASLILADPAEWDADGVSAASRLRHLFFKISRKRRAGAG